MSVGVQTPIDASTRLCAVFGHPIRHSASPAMHNAALAELQLNWRYLAFEVHPDHLRAAINGAKRMGFVGINLTVPHKLLALDMVDVVDARAKEWGAVNTIVFEAMHAGQWKPAGQIPGDLPGELRAHGYNTDAGAIVQSLKEDFQWPELRGAKVLLLGAGGAARAAALRLADEQLGALHIVNRTEENARKLADAVSARQPSLQVSCGYPEGSVDLVLNATSLGLKAEDGLPMDIKWLRDRRPARVYDMIYRPKETALLRAAKAAGCRTANGLGMLLYQGAEALRLWTGRPPPAPVMRAALEKTIHG